MRKILIFFLVVSILLAVLIVFYVGFITFGNSPIKNDSTASIAKSMDSGKVDCTPKDNHAKGVLTATFDDSGILNGWVCSMGSHMNCTAGSDGIWKTCDFPPDVMVWPPRVSQKALDNPKLYVAPAVN